VVPERLRWFHCFKIFIRFRQAISISGVMICVTLPISHEKDCFCRSQRIDLFSGNVVDNIAVGEFNPDMTRVIEICEKLGMTKFVEQLPQGFNTYLGENGATLSGGQQQRIAIARALYRNPEILILDEATSSLDSLSEAFVQNTLRLLGEESKTVIVIAHRLSTISMAQRIIMLEKGKVVQDGSLAELTLSNGPFRTMWMHQTIDIKEPVKL